MGSLDVTQKIGLRYRAAVNVYWVEDITRLFTCVSGRSLRLQVITHATPSHSSSAAHRHCTGCTGKATTRGLPCKNAENIVQRHSVHYLGRRVYTSRIQNRVQGGVTTLVSVLHEILIQRKKGTSKYHKEQRDITNRENS